MQQNTYAFGKSGVFWSLTISALCTALLPVRGWCVPAQVPLFLTTTGNANVLVILDNSNSMDEAPSGTAVGSNNAGSKSEIARTAIKNLITTYTGKINMGLMAYRQSGVQSYYLSAAPYDASFNPATYDPTWTGDRASTTRKRYRIPNPTSAGNFIYFNVNLPSYSSGPQGNLFCYSSTARAFNNAEIPPTDTSSGGPWDTYSCYNRKTGTSDAAPGTTGAGYSGFQFSTSFFPTDSDLAQGITDFGTRLTSYDVGPTWFSNSSPGRGYLHVPIKALDAAQAGALNAKLACNIPGAPAPCSTAGLQNAGQTPIEGTLLTAKDYFGAAWTTASEGYTASCYPLPNSCGRSFVVLLTDGLPSTDKTGATLTNPATAIAGAAAAAKELKDAGIETYVLGFSLPYGVDPTSLNQIAVAGGTTSAYSASDPASLAGAFNTIFTEIQNKTSSSSSIAVNSTRLDGNDALYQGTFNSSDWTGKMFAYRIDADGKPNSPAWDASTQIPTTSARNILTYNPTVAAPRGRNFLWTNLSAAQATAIKTLSGVASTDAIGQNRLNYVRGDQSLEAKNGGTFRNRNSLLGDIVNSDAVYVGSENYGYDKLPGTEGGSYVTYRNSTTIRQRRRMVYVGANDGMFHGFDAGTYQTSTKDFNLGTGAEKVAYVPNDVFGNLSALTAPTYNHLFFVDGSPAAGDAYFDSNGDNAKEWRTVVVGTTGAGGRAIFALDVTDPDSISANRVLWEISNAQSPTATDLTDDTASAVKRAGFQNNLGYTLQQPAIVRMKSGQFAVVFGNGYDSANFQAVLYIVDLQTGQLIRSINTGYGSSTDKNGLSSPFPIDTNNDRIIDAIYAGDLRGNLWKFNVDDTNPANWDVAFKSGATPLPLTVACSTAGATCSNANRQPITARPESGRVGSSQNGGVMVYFGTGKYYETGDNTVGSQVQTFYGVWDNGATIAGRDDLQVQTITAETGVNEFSLRVSTQNEVNWNTQKGWYMDLKPSSGTLQGERVISYALLRGGRVIFTTILPPTTTCGTDSSSWLMELEAVTGKRLPNATPPWDIAGPNNGATDGKIDANDLVKVGSTLSSPSGKKSRVGIIKVPGVIEGSNGVEFKYQTGSMAVDFGGGATNLESLTESSSNNQRGRQTWLMVR